MSNRIILQAAACAVLMLAMAQEGFAQSHQPQGAVPYGGFSLGIGTYHESGFGQDFNATFFVLVSRLGTYINDYFSVEVRAGLGLNEGDVSGGHDLKFKVDTFIGGYGRIGIPTDSPVTPYATFGYAVSRFSSNYRDSSPSFGFGMDWDLQNGFLINGEFTNYHSTDGFTFNMFSAGFAYRY